MATQQLESAVRTSPWQASKAVPDASQLQSDLQVDVCIVGGGIAGLSTALELAKQNQSVAVVDDGHLAHGMSICTTAHLTNVIDDTFVKMEKWHGEDGAQLAAESHAAAIDRIEQIIADYGIACDFRRLDGYLFCAPDDDLTMLEDELAAVLRAGVAAEMVARAPLGHFDTGPAIRYPDQARFHPAKYYAGLVRAIESLGGKLFANTHVDKVEGGNDARVTIGGRAIKASAIVVTTNVPINDMLVLHTKQAPYMTYVVGIRAPRRALTDALFWDTQEMYHYVRVQELDDAHDLIIIGGEDHKSGQADDTADRHDRLEQWARRRMPFLGPVEYCWGGQCMETVDGLAFTGRNPADNDNIYVHTGDSGMGLTHGTIAGTLLSDLILGRENPWESLYDPSRKTIAAARPFIEENVNVARQYTDWLTPGDVSSVDDIPFGSGAIIRQGLTKLAVSRGDDGQLTKLSAVCPHLGCIVRWNQAEQTWDCPCHGSRFRATGEVVNGPANRGLAPHGES